MWRQETIDPRLVKLSGMLYHGAKYTCAQWKEIAGVDPQGVPGIGQTRHGLCFLTDEGRGMLRKRTAANANNYALLGIATA